MQSRPDLSGRKDSGSFGKSERKGSSQIPMERFGEAEDVAQAVAVLA